MEKPTLKFTSSWDDGNPLDLKIAELLLKYDLPGTFYIPSVSRMENEQIQLLARDFDIGGHTVNHPMDMKLLSDEDMDFELKVNKDWLEGIISRPVTKFCYTRGRYDDRVIEAVKRAGYTSARTTTVLNLIPDDPFKTHTTIHVFPRAEYGVVEWDTEARAYAYSAAVSGGTFHLWGHALELERLGYWGRLEDFFTWLTTNFNIQPV